MNSSTSTDTATPVISTIREIGQHEGQTVTIRGWLYNLRASGKLLFPDLPRRQRHHPGRGRQAAVSPELFEAIKGLTQESSVIVTGKVRADKRAPGGYELDVTDAQVVQRVNPDDPYPDHAEGARRRLPDGAPASVAALAAAGGDPAGARRDHQGGARLLRRARLHPDRSADPDAGRVRRHDHALPGRLLRGAGVT